MPDLKEKKNGPTGRPKAWSDALVRRVTGVTTRRITVGVIEENRDERKPLDRKDLKRSAIFRRDAKRWLPRVAAARRPFSSASSRL